MLLVICRATLLEESSADNVNELVFHLYTEEDECSAGDYDKRYCTIVLRVYMVQLF